MNRRLRLTLLGLALACLSMVGLAPWVLSVVALPLFVVWVGMPLFLLATLLVRVLARAGRHWAGWVLQRDIPRPYRARTGGPWWGRLRWVLTDPATWRDLLWVLLNCVAGLTLGLLAVVLLAGSLHFLVYPLLVAVTPAGVFDTLFGFIQLDGWVQAFAVVPLGVAALGVWWVATPLLLGAWARLTAALLGPTRAAVLAGRVETLSASRAETRDSAAAELRRIERDLHDGVQVRLASMGMTLGLAEELMATDPVRARQLLGEAADATSLTLEELRALVRGIHPPVLADRGLVGAVRALALDAPLRTSVAVEGFGADERHRLPAPVEACAYFTVAEALANTLKHAGATRVDILLAHDGSRLQVVVSDDGVGGASLVDGSGLAGISRRVEAFDGILSLTSPAGGPTHVTMEIPCELSSPRTTPSFETA
ncbi:sensor histidine kinase [Auraticoccus sp. F435]|uniref:histidine kinase n=1 Tax=Auraticoccus cholistanensis TaxID=2656650 RepID=A0A6A9UZW7_9ACTN|nr:sensor histidine kinase [Auraticoccus cholistanensis]MVA74559.1 sensor histidine kinase [Auraticoccus cholistanensis]